MSNRNPLSVAKADRTFKTTDDVEVKVGDVVFRASTGFRRGPDSAPSIAEHKVLAISPSGDVAVATKTVRPRWSDHGETSTLREIPNYETRYAAHLFASREACKKYIVDDLTAQMLRAQAEARSASERLTLAVSL
jgi:hypothetical protein